MTKKYASDTLEAEIRSYCMQKYKKQPRENLRFNRLEINSRHFYLEQFGTRSLEYSRNPYAGFIKCKLAHGIQGSVIIPDQIYLRRKTLLWIQPLCFYPNLILFDEGKSICSLFVDISFGYTLEIKFKNSDFIRHFDDGSSLFKCQIYGPKDLKEYATGKACIKDDNSIYLYLFHHTTEKRKQQILQSGYLKASRWNIQGNKSLNNVHYIYFTCLEQIKTDDDLRKIAMANDGKLRLKIDNSIAPQVLPINWKQQPYKNDILELEIFRQSTYDRRSSLKFLVDASTLAPSHLLMHSPNGAAVFYEVSNPFIYRVGVSPGEILQFTKETLDNDQAKLKRFQYTVLGNATTLEGLAAPYDEENTTQLFKLETIPENMNILDFWSKNGNQDLYSRKIVELQEFSKLNK